MNIGIRKLMEMTSSQALSILSVEDFFFFDKRTIRKNSDSMIPIIKTIFMLIWSNHFELGDLYPSPKQLPVEARKSMGIANFLSTLPDTRAI